MKKGKEYDALVLEVLDGDTLFLRTDLGHHLFIEEYYRIAGINAYETRLGKRTTAAMKRKGLAGKKFLAGILTNKIVQITTYKAKRRYKLRTHRGKYGRYIIDVLFPRPGDKDGPWPVNIAVEMVKRGYAVYKKY